jgi:glycosyltransferase involved in cell wall biosynthesis
VLRIGLNLIFLHPTMGGVRVVCLQLLKAICTLLGQHSGDFKGYIFIAPEGRELLEADPALQQLIQAAEVTIVEVSIRSSNRWLRIISEQIYWYRCPITLDILHCFDYLIPYVYPGYIFATLHDFNYLNYPQTFTLPQRWLRHLAVPLTLHRADQIAVVSEMTRQELAQRFPVAPERVVVIRNAYNPLPTTESTLPLTGDYLLAVGTLKAHKNYDRLLQAFASLPYATLHLHIVGRDDGAQPQLEALARQLNIAERVTFWGFVSEPVLAQLYRHARLFVMPSLYEGFGMPVLEAMSQQVPVACSAIPALQEVAGEAALYFDPTDYIQIAQALTDLLADETYCLQLIDLGIARVQQFSWLQSAEILLTTYTQIGRSRSPLTLPASLLKSEPR